MKSSADPLQGVVADATCAGGSGLPVPEGAVAAATPPARIEAIIARRLSEARRDLRIATVMESPMLIWLANERINELVGLSEEIQRGTAAGGGGSNEEALRPADEGGSNGR